MLFDMFCAECRSTGNKSNRWQKLAKADLELVQDAEVTRGGAWTTSHQILHWAAQPCTQRSFSCRSLTPPRSQPFACLCSSTMYIAMFCFLLCSSAHLRVRVFCFFSAGCRLVSWQIFFFCCIILGPSPLYSARFRQQFRQGVTCGQSMISGFGATSLEQGGCSQCRITLGSA